MAIAAKWATALAYALLSAMTNVQFLSGLGTPAGREESNWVWNSTAKAKMLPYRPPVACSKSLTRLDCTGSVCCGLIRRPCVPACACMVFL